MILLKKKRENQWRQGGKEAETYPYLIFALVEEEEEEEMVLVLVSWRPRRIVFMIEGSCRCPPAEDRNEESITKITRGEESIIVAGEKEENGEGGRRRMEKENGPKSKKFGEHGCWVDGCMGGWMSMASAGWGDRWMNG